jgi:hypothetical protein
VTRTLTGDRVSTMKRHRPDDGFDYEMDDLPPPLSSRIDHMSRKWAEEEAENRGRHNRRAMTRRRIEDWREDRSLQRALDDDLDLG